MKKIDPGSPDQTTFFGSPVAQLDCSYRTSDGKYLDVFVRYALPIDLNPWNDFYIGCTVTGHPQSTETADVLVAAHLAQRRRPEDADPP